MLGLAAHGLRCSASPRSEPVTPCAPPYVAGGPDSPLQGAQRQTRRVSHTEAERGGLGSLMELSGPRGSLLHRRVS